MTEPILRIGRPPSKPRRPWYRSPLLLVAAPVAAIALFATGAFGVWMIRPALRAAVTPDTLTVGGYLALDNGDFTWSTETEVCSGKGGYDDIRGGTQVVVSDASGATIAIGALDAGYALRDPNNDLRALYCRFQFKLAVPSGHQFYGLAIGRRGKLTYTRETITQPLELNLR